ETIPVLVGCLFVICLQQSCEVSTSPPLPSWVTSDFLSGAHLLVAQCDTWVARLLFPLALVILLSGLDDLALDCVCLWARLQATLRHRFSKPLATEQKQLPHIDKRIAIFVPLWHEYAVISGMVEHNASAINYSNYHFFIGAYPNDDPTLDAVRDLETRFPHVH